MTLRFHRAEQAWFGDLGSVGIHLTAAADGPDEAQLGIARYLEHNLPSLQLRASSYLDLFVDRARACGDGNEPWWLDEIEVRGSVTGRPPSYHMNFRLTGDDGGMWSVEMLVSNCEHRPVRFERRQG